MKSVDILAFGAHPDDVELGCGGSISLSKSQGKSIAIIDLDRTYKIEDLNNIAKQFIHNHSPGKNYLYIL